MEVIGRGVLVDLGCGAFLGTDAAGEVAEMVRRQRDVGVQGFTHGLAVVPGFGDGEHLQVLLDAIGNLQQDQRARLHAGLAPRVGSCMGGVQGFLDIGGIGAGKLGNRLAVHWREVGEVLPVDWLDELAIDEVAVAGLEANDGTVGAGRGVDHGRLQIVLGWRFAAQSVDQDLNTVAGGRGHFLKRQSEDCRWVGPGVRSPAQSFRERCGRWPRSLAVWRGAGWSGRRHRSWRWLPG